MGKESAVARKIFSVPFLNWWCACRSKFHNVDGSFLGGRSDRIEWEPSRTYAKIEDDEATGTPGVVVGASEPHLPNMSFPFPKKPFAQGEEGGVSKNLAF